jgi:hypothetical protein
VLPPAARRFAYPCVDWSERRDHLAGTLAVALLELALQRDWLRRVDDSRALQLTPTGRTALAPWLERGDQSPPRSVSANASASRQAS